MPPGQNGVFSQLTHELDELGCPPVSGCCCLHASRQVHVEDRRQVQLRWSSELAVYSVCSRAAPCGLRGCM